MVIRRDLLGQEAMEFALIGGLIFCVAIGTTLLFGNKMASFFHNESAMAKVANTTPYVHSSDNSKNFSADYETYAANPEKPEENSKTANTISITVDGITVDNIPDDLSTTIMTSGIAGNTDLISSSISGLAEQLKVISENNPENPDIQEIANLTIELSKSGQMIADAEEWFELAAQFRSSDLKYLAIPEDNKIPEGGSTYTDAKFANDNQIWNYDYIYKRPWLFDSLKEHTDSFKDINSKINQLGTNQTEEVKNIVAVLDKLSSSIVDISDNVKSTVEAKKAHTNEDFLSNVASKTTDLKSKLIEDQATEDSLLSDNMQN